MHLLDTLPRCYSACSPGEGNPNATYMYLRSTGDSHYLLLGVSLSHGCFSGFMPFTSAAAPFLFLQGSVMAQWWQCCCKAWFPSEKTKMAPKSLLRTSVLSDNTPIDQSLVKMKKKSLFKPLRSHPMSHGASL